MFGTIIKDLYIGKSKLNLVLNNLILEPTEVFGNCLCPTGFTGNMPDYGNYGKFKSQYHTFIITPVKPEHKIYVTGIPKGSVLDNFRLEDLVWSSYYEDDRRGYLFQVIPVNNEPKLIINGSN